MVAFDKCFPKSRLECVGHVCPESHRTVSSLSFLIDSYQCDVSLLIGLNARTVIANLFTIRISI